METSREGKIEIISHEAISQTKYKDSRGWWTIGIGMTVSEIPDLNSWPLKKELSLKDIFSAFEKSLKKYEKAINEVLPEGLPQHQFDALVSWCYNVGIGWPRKATVIKSLKGGNSAVMVTRGYNKDVLTRLVNTNYDSRGNITAPLSWHGLMMFHKQLEIVSRREKEANLLAYGTYSSDGYTSVFPVSNLGNPQYSKGKRIKISDYL